MPDSVMQTATAEGAITVRRSPELGKLLPAFLKAQTAIEGAKKDTTNPHFKTQYADLASVWEAVKKPLADNNLIVTQWPRTVGNGVEIETMLFHTSGEFLADCLWVPCSKNDAQGLGSAITYGRRYALMAVLGVCPVDDDGAAAVASHKPGAPGSAGGGTDFRPPGPRRPQSGGNWVDEARNDGTLDETRKKGTSPGAPTAEEARQAKLREATDKRIKALKDGAPWTRAGLDQFWRDDKKWIDWMSDTSNKALDHYERFSRAFADAETTMREVA